MSEVITKKYIPRNDNTQRIFSVLGAFSQVFNLDHIKLDTLFQIASETTCKNLYIMHASPAAGFRLLLRFCVENGKKVKG